MAHVLPTAQGISLMGHPEEHLTWYNVQRNRTSAIATTDLPKTLG